MLPDLFILVLEVLINIVDEVPPKRQVVYIMIKLDHLAGEISSLQIENRHFDVLRPQEGPLGPGLRDEFPTVRSLQLKVVYVIALGLHECRRERGLLDRQCLTADDQP